MAGTLKKRLGAVAKNQDPSTIANAAAAALHQKKNRAASESGQRSKLKIILVLFFVLLGSLVLVASLNPIVRSIQQSRKEAREQAAAEKKIQEAQEKQAFFKVRKTSKIISITIILIN